MDTKTDNNTPAGADQIMQTLQQMLEQNRLLAVQNRLLVEQIGAANDRCERLLEKYEEIEDRIYTLRQGLTSNLREFYAILIETLGAAIGARRVAWNYVARTVLEGSGFAKERIERIYEDEKRAWIEERERIIDEIEKAVESINNPTDVSSYIESVLADQAGAVWPDLRVKPAASDGKEGR